MKASRQTAGVGAASVSALIRLRADLQHAQYDQSHVEALLGVEAYGACARGVFSPARAALARSASSPLSVLCEVFVLGHVVALDMLADAFPRLTVEEALTMGLLTQEGERHARAAVSLTPVELPDPEGEDPQATRTWWFLSDLDDSLRQGAAPSDHVMGVGAATRSLLAQIPLPRAMKSQPVTALDIGTGSGVLALWLLAAGAHHVIATDVSARALDFAWANAHLNGFSASRPGEGPAPSSAEQPTPKIELRQGSLFEPVGSERFTLIVTNPPFVITPRSTRDVPHYEYRDAGLVGDALAQRVVQSAPSHLAQGGLLVMLANWEYHWGNSGLQRVESWIRQGATEVHGSLSAWVIERDRVSPLQYSETWVRDGGTQQAHGEYERLLGEWLTDFSSRQVTAVGLGVIRVLHTASADASLDIRTEEVSGSIATPIGTEMLHVHRHALTITQMSDAEILERRWLRAANISEFREHTPGMESPHTITLRVSSPFHRTITVDPVVAAAIGACDGDLTMEQIAEALATLLELDALECAAHLCEAVRELVWCGVLSASAQ